MLVRIGRQFFRWRNALGPVVFVLALVIGKPHYPFDRSDADIVFDLAGALLALGGEALRILTIGYEYIERGGRDREVYASLLVQGGVFAHCRNPLYLGNILMATGFALIVHSWAFYLLVVPFVLFAYACIVATEEAFLRQKFGTEYDAYRARVNRWWPRWAGWKESVRDMRFNWGRVLVKEYNTLFMLLLALVALRLWCDWRITGSVPPPPYLASGFACWLAGYLLVRGLKKSGRVRV